MNKKERIEFIKLKIKKLEDMVSTLQDELDYLEGEEE
jgi:hypothetical protein